MKYWVLNIGMSVVLYYADLISDVFAIQGFWAAGAFQYMTLNIAIVFAGTITGAVLMDGLCYKLLVAFQLLPLYLAVKTYLIVLVVRWRTSLRSDDRDVATLAIAEALVESLLSCIFQVYALVHETWTSAQKTLQVSILISVLSLAKFFSEFDIQEKGLWRGQFKFDLVKGRTPQVTCGRVVFGCWLV